MEISKDRYSVSFTTSEDRASPVRQLESHWPVTDPVKDCLPGAKPDPL